MLRVYSVQILPAAATASPTSFTVTSFCNLPLPKIKQGCCLATAQPATTSRHGHCMYSVAAFSPSCLVICTVHKDIQDTTGVNSPQAAHLGICTLRCSLPRNLLAHTGCLVAFIIICKSGQRPGCQALLLGLGARLQAILDALEAGQHFRVANYLAQICCVRRHCICDNG